jgi:hypothetical protein
VQQEFRKRAAARAKAAKASGGADATDARAAAFASSLAAGKAVNGGAGASGTRQVAPDAPMDVADDDDNGNTNGDNMSLMLESIGQLQLDDGGWDFHGSSSGAVFLSRMMAHFGGRLGQAPFLPLPKTRPSVPSTAESSPSGPGGGGGASTPDGRPPSTSGSATAGAGELPSKHEVRTLCAFALTYGAGLVRILHQPSFYSQLDTMYDKPAHLYTDDDMRFLGLLYALMALGCVYRSLDAADASATWQSAKEEG